MDKIDITKDIYSEIQRIQLLHDKKHENVKNVIDALEDLSCEKCHKRFEFEQTGKQFKNFAELFYQKYNVIYGTQVAVRIFGSMLEKGMEESESKELEKMFLNLIRCFRYEPMVVGEEEKFQIWFNWFIEAWRYSNHFSKSKEETKKIWNEHVKEEVERIKSAK